MCGIAGLYVARGRQAPRQLVLEMAGELAHRGPDGVGLYLDDRFAMANTRLSIIDVEGGDQPQSSEDGRFWVMQNGEIYNYPELTVELKGLGHRFRTRSDTEVIVHAFEQWGKACLDRFNGEFAIAIWDRDTKELFLARDRFGIRPLFVAEFGGDIVFASEAAALLRHHASERRLDPLALVETFTLWSVLPDRSAFPGIYEVPAGHHVVVGDCGLGPMQRWWDIPFGPREGTRKECPEALADELEHLLDDATRIRLRADVPVGVYLSGGLDSSVTTSLARRHVPHQLRAFSVGFDDERFDESSFQDHVAATLGVDMTRITLAGHDIAAAFPEVVRRAEKPLLRSAPAPLLRLSRSVRDAGMKVVLTGEGADELFAGYGIFQEAMIRRFWARRPDSSIRSRLLTRVYPYLSRDLARSGAFMEAFFRAGLENLDDALYSHRPRIATTMRNLRFLSADVRAEASAEGDTIERLIARLPRGYDRFGPLGRAQYLEIHSFLAGYLLHSQGDRMLMANSVEGRFPFLDVHVAEFAAALPERLRLRDLDDKYLLRQAFTRSLPRGIGARPKRPYRAPILHSFFGPQAPAYVREVLSTEHVAASGLFEANAVEKLVAKCDRYLEVGLGEGEEMGLVGVLSTLLLLDAMVTKAKLAPAARPTRIVIGDALVTPACMEA